MMASYAQFVRGGGATQGKPPVEGDHCGDSGGVRREWWWVTGPVDSCCFFFTLRTGVGLLAASTLLKGLVTALFMRGLYVAGLEQQLVDLRQQHDFRACADYPVFTPDCEQFSKGIQQTEGIIKQFLGVFLVQGAFSALAGVVGLWAVWFGSARAAEMYTLSWPADFLLRILATLKLNRLVEKYHVEQVPGGNGPLMRAVQILIVIYCTKVSWSYYKVRLDQESAHSGASPKAVGKEQSIFAVHRRV